MMLEEKQYGFRLLRAAVDESRTEQRETNATYKHYMLRCKSSIIVVGETKICVRTNAVD